MRTSKIFILTASLLLGGGVGGTQEAMARDWPNPFGWMKKKMKGEKNPPPPPSVTPPRPSVTPPAPPVPRPPTGQPPRNPNPPSPSTNPAPPTPQGPTTNPAPQKPAPAGVDPGPPGSQKGGSKGGPTGGAEPAPPVHVHVFREVREEVVEPARYERVPAGVDQFGAPRFENRLVAPERRVMKPVKKCSCGERG